MSFTPKPGLLTQRLDGEYIVFDPQNDRIHTLNTTAQLIWLKCAESLGIDELITEITTRYDVPHERVQRDIHQAVDQLCDLGLLCPAGAH